MGAGLFGHLGRPIYRSVRVEDEGYTRELAIGAAICLLSVIGAIVYLYLDHHHNASFALIAFGVIWVYGGYDRARLTR
jgi:hypothetical protein